MQGFDERGSRVVLLFPSWFYSLFCYIFGWVLKIHPHLWDSILPVSGVNTVTTWHSFWLIWMQGLSIQWLHDILSDWSDCKDCQYSNYLTQFLTGLTARIVSIVIQLHMLSDWCEWEYCKYSDSLKCFLTLVCECCHYSDTAWHASWHWSDCECCHYSDTAWHVSWHWSDCERCHYSDNFDAPSDWSEYCQYTDTAWHAFWLCFDCKCYQCSNGLTDVLPMLPFSAGVIHFFFSLTPSMQESIVFTGWQAQHYRIVNILMKYINQEYETKSRTAEFH